MDGPRETRAARGARHNSDAHHKCAGRCVLGRERAAKLARRVGAPLRASLARRSLVRRLSRALVSEQAWTACRRRSRAFARCRRRPRTTTRRSTCCTSGAKLTRAWGLGRVRAGLCVPASRVGCYRRRRAACPQGSQRTLRTGCAYQPRAYRAAPAPASHRGTAGRADRRGRCRLPGGGLGAAGRSGGVLQPRDRVQGPGAPPRQLGRVPRRAGAAAHLPRGELQRRRSFYPSLSS